MSKRKYFSYIGSYEGAVQVKEKWTRVKDLNYIDKTSWERHQGPPTKKIQDALNQDVAWKAIDLFPYLEIKK